MLCTFATSAVNDLLSVEDLDSRLRGNDIHEIGVNPRNLRMGSPAGE